MKNIFYILASAIVALGAVACQNEVDENINPNTQNDVVSFTVSFDDNTRIALGTVENGEASFVFEGNETLYLDYNSNTFEFTNTPENRNTFTGEGEGLSEIFNNNYYVTITNNTGADLQLASRAYETFGEAAYFRFYGSINGDVTLSLNNYVIHCTTGADDVTLYCDYYDGGDDTAPESLELDANGEYWINLENAYANEINVSYKINDTTVKEATLNAKVNNAYGYKIFNLGTLSTDMTIANVAALIEKDEPGSTITLPAGATITGSDILTIDKNITIDGNGATFSSTAGRAINVSGEGVDVAISNLNIECTGERGVNVIQNAQSVTLTDVNITAANYAVNVAGSAGDVTVTISNSTITGLNAVNVAGVGATVTVDNCTINCEDNNPDEGYSPISLNKDGVNGTITVTNSTINITGEYAEDTTEGSNAAKGGTVTINNSTENVSIEVCYIQYGDYYYAFTSVANAIEYANEKDNSATIVLLRDAEIAQEGTFKIDVNDFTLTPAEGFKIESIDEENNTVTVVTWNPVASVEDVEYENLADALTAAGTTKVITLLADATNVATACVINANGHALTTGDGFLALKNYNNANGYFDVVAVTKATDCAIPGTHNNWDTTANGVYIINGTSLRVAPNVAMDANNEFKFYLLNWDRAKGATTANAITVNSKLTAGGTNIKVGTKGTYDLYLNGNVAFYVANQDTNNKNIRSTLGASTGDLFLNFNGQDWAASNATIAAYYYGGPSEATFVKMTDTNSDGIYECTAPADDYTHIIFVRLSEDTLNWDKKWNQTPGDSKVALKGAGSLGILTAYEQVEIVY